MDIGWKLVSGVAAAGAGLVANKAVDASWKGFTGHQSPTDDTEDEFGLGEGDAATLGDHLGIEPLPGKHHGLGILGRAGNA